MKRSTYLVFLFLSFAFITSAQSVTNWEHTNGPNGGALSLLGANENYAFISGGNRLYRTADGMNWEPLSVKGGFALLVYGDTIIHITTKKDSEGFDQPQEFLMSFNNGDTWLERNMPPVGSIYGGRSIVFTSHGIYYIHSASQTIYHSSNLGLTWDTMSLPAEYINDIWNLEDNLFCRKGSSIFRFDPVDNNWEEILVPVESGESIDDILVKGESIYVQTETNLWYSHDDGITWENNNFLFGSTTGRFVSNENSSSIYYVRNDANIFKISDLGNDIQLVYSNEEVRFFDISTILFKNGIITYTAYEGLVRWDENLEVLTYVFSGLHSANVYNLVEHNDKIWAACGSGIYNYDPVLGVWSDSSSLTRTYDSDHRIYANQNGLLVNHEPYDDFIFVSDDNGISWDSINPSDDPDFIQEINIVDDNIFLKIRFNPTLVSRDNGVTWQEIDLPDSEIKIVKFANQYLAFDDNIIFSSSDEGNSWSEFSDVSQVSIDGHEMEDLLVVGNRLFGIFGFYNSTRIYSSLDGQEWMYAYDGLPEIEEWYDGPFEYEVRDFGIFQHEDKYYFYNADAGLYVSYDNAVTWILVIPATGKEVIEKDGILYMGGRSGGGVIRFEAPGAYENLISGTVYYDDNNNGVFDVGESEIPNVNVNLDIFNGVRSSYFTTTSSDGDYSLGVYNISFDTLRPLPNLNYIESINPPYHLTDEIGDNRNFGIYLTPDITDLSARIYSNIMRPGFDTRMTLITKNEGTISSSGTISLKLDPAQTFLNAEPAPSEILGDSLVWNYQDLDLLQYERIKVDINVDQTTELGSEICNTMSITPTNTDTNPSDNLYSLKTTVIGSYDPNDKRVEPAEGLNAEEIAAAKELTYTIRFQNTGTFYAEKVRITDLLDTALYYPSFRLIAASHDITSLELRPGGLLEIEFDQIFLPDSTNNEPESHGFVSFAIQRNKQYNFSKAVENTAAIYFDFNEPIFTNTVSFTVPETPVATSDLSTIETDDFLVYPNPANKQFFIDASALKIGKATLRLQSTSGILLSELMNQDTEEMLSFDVSKLPNGVYFIQLVNENKTLTQKIIIMNE